MLLVKNLPTQWENWGGKPDKGSIDEKTLKNEGKNRQIEIDEKPPNPVGTKEENRSYAWAFRLVLCGFLDRAIGGWPAVLPFSAAKPNRRRLNHQGLGPSWVKLSQVKLSRVKPSLVKPSEVKRQDRFGERRATDWLVKNLLTQWELRRKTDIENLRFI